MKAAKYLSGSFMVCVLLVLMSPGTKAQTPLIDSLRIVLSRATDDTMRVMTLLDLAESWETVGPQDSAVMQAERALSLSANFNGGKDRWLRGMALSFRELGIFYSHSGDYLLAVKNHSAALRISTVLKDKKGTGSALGNLGNIHYKQGNFPQALTYYIAARKVFDELGNKIGVISVLNNSGLIYIHQKNYVAALANFQKSLSLYNSTADRGRMIPPFMYIGQVYKGMGSYDTAMQYFERAIEFEKRDGNKQGYALLLTHIAGVYEGEGQPQKALANYREALRLREAISDEQGRAGSCIDIGRLLVAMKETKEGKKYLLQGLELARNIHSKVDIQKSYASLCTADSMLGDWASALMNYRNSIAFRDSLLNEENTKKTVRLEMQYEFDKKEAATRLEREKKDAVSEADKNRQRLVLLAVSVFGLFVLVFAVYAYRSLLQKKRANEEILRQKHIIEEKQKEILDSIYYARRIQRSLLPPEKYLERMLSVSGQSRRAR